MECKNECFLFVVTNTVADLDKYTTRISHCTVKCKLRSNFSFHDSKSWFLQHYNVKHRLPEGGIVIDLSNIALELFLLLVPHICGPDQKKYGGLIGLICEYVHYGPKDSFLETVNSLKRQFHKLIILFILFRSQISNLIVIKGEGLSGSSKWCNKCGNVKQKEKNERLL